MTYIHTNFLKIAWLKSEIFEHGKFTVTCLFSKSLNECRRFYDTNVGKNNWFKG